jgi:hypothetical protein
MAYLPTILLDKLSRIMEIAYEHMDDILRRFPVIGSGRVLRWE